MTGWGVILGWSGGAGVISTSWTATFFGDGGRTGTTTGVGSKKKSRARFLRGGDLFGASDSGECTTMEGIIGRGGRCRAGAEIAAEAAADVEKKSIDRFLRGGDLFGPSESGESTTMEEIVGGGGRCGAAAEAVVEAAADVEGGDW